MKQRKPSIKYSVTNGGRWAAMAFYSQGLGYGYVNPYEPGTDEHEYYLQGWEHGQELFGEGQRIVA